MPTKIKAAVTIYIAYNLAEAVDMVVTITTSARVVIITTSGNRSRRTTEISARMG